MRTLTLLILVALCGAAAADSHHARDCAEAATGLAEHRAIARAMDMEIASAPITDEQIALWRECQRRMAVAERIARLRAEIDAEQLEINRMLGLLQPGGGYHIVYFADGRVVGSAYFGGRVVTPDQQR